MIDTDIYMKWLLDQVIGVGCRVLRGRIDGDLATREAAILEQFDVDAIVNCTGLGSRELTGEPMYPLRGALVYVHNDGRSMPRITGAHCMSYDESIGGQNMVFIVPRGRDLLVLGGLVEPEEWDTDLTLQNYQPIREMFRRCRDFLPILRGATLLGADYTDVDLGAIASNLRMAVSGGAALPVEILEQAHSVLGVRIREGYGLSETSPLATFNHPNRDAKPGSIGQPVWGVRLRLIDDDWNEVPDGEVGEIAIRGHNVMKGYLGRPEATAEVIRDGWFRTGDLARRDQVGYYYIVDRAKDMIVRGGFNVYPRELEEVIMTHPAVSLAAVVGVPHDSHGEEVKAFVITHQGAELTEADLIAWCKANMAGYKYPRLVELCDTLPMNATGKILKRELRDRAHLAVVRSGDRS